MEFEWDLEKAATNVNKHGIDFAEAMTVFGDPLDMSPQSQADANDEMRSEYDFSQGVRGKHHTAYRAGTNVVFLDSDLTEVFPDSASVNQALRLLVKLATTKGVIGGRPNKAPHPTSGANRKSKVKRRSRAARG